MALAEVGESCTDLAGQGIERAICAGGGRHERQHTVGGKKITPCAQRDGRLHGTAINKGRHAFQIPFPPVGSRNKARI